MSASAPPIRLAGSTFKDRPHICAFFNSSDEAHQVLLPFIQEGLALGQKALHTIDPLRREEHTRWLTSAGINVASPNKQIEILDWTQSHLRDGRFDREWTLAFWRDCAATAASAGFPLVRFVSQMEWVLTAELSTEELLEYEAAANDTWINSEGPVSPAVCIYDLRRFSADLIIDVMRTHPLVLVGGLLQENPFYVAPAEFLAEVRQRRANRQTSTKTA